MTPRQKQLLDYIRAYIAEHEYAPTFTEMRKAMGWRSNNIVFEVLRRLEAEGRIRRRPRAARSVEVVEPKSEPCSALQAVRNDPGFMALSHETRVMVTKEMSQRIREGVAA